MKITLPPQIIYPNIESILHIYYNLYYVKLQTFHIPACFLYFIKLRQNKS